VTRVAVCGIHADGRLLHAPRRRRIPHLGPRHFDRRDLVETINRLVERLTDLGCDVEVRRPDVAWL
jgi:hypothetical protein